MIPRSFVLLSLRDKGISWEIGIDPLRAPTMGLHLVCLNLAPPKKTIDYEYFIERGSKDWWIQAIHPEINIRYLFWTSKSPRVALRYHGYR